MTTRDRLLGLAVAVLWGVNFLAIHASLQQFPPFFLVALRFAVIAVPTVLLVPWPRVPVRYLVGYGLGFGTLQFLFLYWAMSSGMPTGLASLVLQSSAPFTVLLGATVLREKLAKEQVAGIVLAAAGLTVVGWQQFGAATLGPFLLTLCGGLGWALGNLSSRLARPAKPLQLTLWMSVVPPLPMLAVSLVVEGPDEIAHSFTGLGSATGLWALAGLAYTVVLGTAVGSGLWTTLLTRYPAARVAPFSMLVPVVGLSSAWWVLGETLSATELVGCAVVVLGVALGSGALSRLRPPRRRNSNRARVLPATEARQPHRAASALSAAVPARSPD